MKFVWKDDVISSSTENRYIVKDDNNEVVYDGIVPVVGSASLFYLNRVAQKLMHRGTVDFTTGVTSHPEMSIGLTLYNESGTPVKYDVYVNAFLGEPIKQLTDPINGKLDPRMFFLWSAYNDFQTVIAINEPQPEPPSGFTLELSGQTDFTSGEQSSELGVVQCSDWDGVIITKTGDWFNFQKTRNSVLLGIGENETYSSRTGELSFYYGGEIRTALTLTQSARTQPSEFVLELSGTTYFDYNYNISKLYVVECTDWSSVQVETNISWIDLTKQDNGVVVEVEVNFGDVARYGVIDFIYDERIIKMVTITQSMYDFTLVVSGDTEFNYEQQTSNLYVVECSNWNDVYIQKQGDWFTATKNSTGVTLSINENTGNTQRTGSVLFYYDGQIVNQQFLKQQSPVPVEPYVYVSGNTEIDYQQQVAYISLVSSNVWDSVSVSSNANWLTYTKTSTGVTLNVSENDGDNPRIGQIYFNYNSQILSVFSLTQQSHSAPVVSGYLKTVAKGSGNIILKAISGTYITANTKTMEYRKNGGEWISGNTKTGITVSVVSGDSIEWRSVEEGINVSGISFGTTTAFFDALGNVMSLCYGSNYEGQYDLATNGIKFRNLFAGSKIVSAENLILPATALSISCYESMFSNCTYLTKAPNLPATSLSVYCYNGMFDGCSSLTTAPELPAISLEDGCYNGMFRNSGIVKSPDLNAPIVAASAYQQMFYNCSSLNSIKCLAETLESSSSTANWVYGVASTGTFTKKSGVSWSSGIGGIPNNWTVQQE